LTEGKNLFTIAQFPIKTFVKGKKRISSLQKINLLHFFYAFNTPLSAKWFYAPRLSPSSRTTIFCMETTTIAGVKVARVGLGTWEIGGQEWGAVTDAVAVSTCLGALERGINLIDTAPIYGQGRAEEIVGKAMRAHGRREEFYIATKAGLERNPSGVFSNSTAARLRAELEASLRRLGTDYIDLYQVHWPDPRSPIAETAALLAGFQREGKVRALGVSNFSIAQMEEFRRGTPLASSQPPYNLFDRQIEYRAHGECCAHGENLLSWCQGHGVAILCYSPLCRSLLGGRLRRGMSFEPSDIRRVDPKFQEPRFSQYITAVERLAVLAMERYGKTVLELAVRWVLDRPGVSVALWGARRPEQLDDAAGVMGWKLDAAAMAEIDRIVAESVTDPVGPEYLTPKVREG
jgi:aryl-alcohol dehydrogenase-like predicted oxidoreductase